MDLKTIGKRIKERRTDLGITGAELAETIGVNKSTICRYEKGQIEDIKIPVIETIAAALNVNPAWILGKTDDPTPRIYPTEINRIVRNTIEQLNRTGLTLDGKPADPETVKTITDALTLGLELARRRDNE